MSFKILFACLVLALAVSAQVDVYTIDAFDSNTLVDPIITDSYFNIDNPLVESASTVDASVLGGGRDVAIVAEGGDENLVVSTSVVGGVWAVGTATGVSGFGLLQYDGVDGVTQLDGPTVNGLNSFDLTIGGLADSFRTSLLTDIDTEFTFFVYDSSNRVSSTTFLLSGGTSFTSVSLAFTDFTGTADFTSVGALEVTLEAFVAVDAQMSGLFLSGTETVPAASIPPATPVPAASPNGFTWYTFDDDDNGRSPCGDEPDRRSYFLSDNNIVYYYFFGFDFSTQEVSSSDAATAVLSTAAAVAGIAAAML